MVAVVVEILVGSISSVVVVIVVVVVWAPWVKQYLGPVVLGPTINTRQILQKFIKVEKKLIKIINLNRSYTVVAVAYIMMNKYNQ